MSDTATHTRSGEGFPNLGRCAGYTLLDPLGEEIGRVETVFLNDSKGPEYVRVRLKTGFMSSRAVLIPVSFAEIDDPQCTITLK